MPEPTTPPGWLPDPSGRFEHRYHNGRDWTADVATGGQRFVDGGAPLTPPPVAPGPAPAVGARRGRNGFATAALVLGITAVAIGWLPFAFVLGAVATVLAIIFGVIGLRRARESGVGHGFALTGVITGTVGIMICAFGLAATIVTIDAFDAYANPEPSRTTVDACGVDNGTAFFHGTIVNDGDTAGDFSIRVAFVRPGTDNAHRWRRIDVTDLAPGASASLDATAPIGLDAVECRITDVNGPLPFGIEV